MRCHSLILGIYIYIRSGSTCQEVAVLHHHTSTVAQNAALLRLSCFYPDITAGKRKM